MGLWDKAKKFGGAAWKYGRYANPYVYAGAWGVDQVKNGFGLGGGPGETPPAPNYTAAGAADDAKKEAYNTEQTRANRPSTTTPFGRSDWTVDEQGNWRLTNQFNAPMDEIARNSSLQMADALRAPMPTGDSARNQAIEAAYGQATSRLDPRWQQREEAQRTQLLNQGLDPTSEASRSAMQELGFQRNDAYTSAMNGAIQQGTAAGDSAFRNNMTARNQPMQDLQGLYGFLGQPSFMGAGRVSDPSGLQAAGMQGQFDMAAFDSAMARAADERAALMELLKTGVSTYAAVGSDERFKQNITRLDVDVIPGVPLATWEYRTEPGRKRLGVIAQDLEVVAPEFVVRDADGMRWVRGEFFEMLKELA